MEADFALQAFQLCTRQDLFDTGRQSRFYRGAWASSSPFYF